MKRCVYHAGRNLQMFAVGDQDINKNIPKCEAAPLYSVAVWIQLQYSLQYRM